MDRPIISAVFLFQEHCVAERVESKALPDCDLVQIEDTPPRFFMHEKGVDEQHKRRSGDVEICNERVSDAEIMGRKNEDVGRPPLARADA